MLDTIALVLVILGAVNWLLVGLVKYNLIANIFGESTKISRGVYTLVGLAGLWFIGVLF
ncbi:MAG: DUF378 domain-containing protein [Bacillota bacterium]